MKITASNVTIMVKDMDKAVEFYTSVLGFKLHQRWENHYAMVDAPGVMLGIHPSEGKPEGSGSVSIGFMIDSFEDAEQLLSQAGITYRHEAGKSGIYAHFTDLDGTHLYFVKSTW